MTEDINPQSQYSPIEVANTFIKRYGKNCPDLSHMKLQKLVYMVHGWWLAYNENPILNEKPQLWKHGPVIDSLYHILKVYGMKPLKEPIQIIFDQNAPIIEGEQNKTIISLIEWVWNRYGHLGALELSDMTHKDGTAWKEVAKRNSFRVPKHMSLSDEDVAKEFSIYKEEFANAAT
jgi:uncharacterized phage-associated protein